MQIDKDTTFPEACGIICRKYPAIPLLIVACLIVAFIVALNNKSDSVASSRAVPSPNAAPSPPALVDAKPIEMSGSDLLAEYHSNEVRADQKFKGRRVKLTGVIRSISKDLMDQPILVIECGDHLDAIRCDMADSTRLEELNSGQNIVILGIVDGLLIGDVQMKDCRVAK
jgi:hypothetical protein